MQDALYIHKNKCTVLFNFTCFLQLGVDHFTSLCWGYKCKDQINIADCEGHVIYKKDGSLVTSLT